MMPPRCTSCSTPAAGAGSTVWARCHAQPRTGAATLARLFIRFLQSLLQTPSFARTTPSSTATRTWCASPRPCTTLRPSCFPTALSGKQAQRPQPSRRAALGVFLSHALRLVAVVAQSRGATRVEGSWTHWPSQLGSASTHSAVSCGAVLTAEFAQEWHVHMQVFTHSSLQPPAFDVCPSVAAMGNSVAATFPSAQLRTGEPHSGCHKKHTLRVFPASCTSWS